ncbi:MAG: DUF362 domain-containing protein [Acidobacteria bacterium]|jgi:uncharacterized protein (DUF362 family)|nr:DUF362 domain-containing protein [Acidobacteriota bacterium]
MAKKQKTNVSRRKFIGTFGASSLLLLAPPWAKRLEAEPAAFSDIFHVENIPNAPFTEGDNRHAGVEALLALMHDQGLAFYRSGAAAPLCAPQGLIAADDVVLIKVNAQWKYRGCTNSDVIRGLVQRILDHPDGFRGEVVIVENGQGRGSLRCDTRGAGAYENTDVHANAVNEAHSFVHLVEQVFADPRVSAFLFDPIRSTFIGAEDHATNGYRRFENVSYPCFTSAGGRRIELREGIWTGAGYSQNLKLINVPVLKHHDSGGSEITASLKHMYGLVSMVDGFGERHYLRLGETCGKMMALVRPPVLNIIDAIWVSLTALKGHPVDTTRRRNTLVASQDPVALDYWTAKHVLYPIDGNPRHHPGHESIQRWLQQAEQTINGRGGLYHPEWGIVVGAVTRDEAAMSVHSAQAGPPPALLLTAPNGGETWKRGSAQTIAWSFSGDAGTRLSILLLSGAVTKLTLTRTASLANGSFKWNIPADLPKGNQYRIRIISREYPSLQDTSDQVIAIGMAPAGTKLTVTSPNGGESWQRGSRQIITWAYSGQPGADVLILLLKAGKVVQTISAKASLGADGTGSFSWLIPASLASGRDYAIRVRSLAFPDCRGQSAGYFTISR